MNKAASKDKILIIDDQPSVRFGLRSLLEGEGYRALEAETGAQAIAAVTENSCSICVCPMRMGWNSCRASKRLMTTCR
jgi:two-component system OmpR family response regulator